SDMWLKRVFGKKRLTLTTEEFLKLVVSVGLGVPWDESGAAWEWPPLLHGESARRCSPELRERIGQEQPYLQMFVAVLAAEDTMQESGYDRASFRTAVNQMLQLT